MIKPWGTKECAREHTQRAPEVQLTVFYNKGGRKVKANGTRFSSKGCVVYTKSPHVCGTPFSLDITNPHSNKAIQVDSSVILNKRFDNAKKWGMVVRFMNLTEGEKDEIHQLVTQAAATKRASESKYLNTPIGQAIRRCFNLKVGIE